MGSWGTGPTENDAALDFIGGIKASRKANRAAKVEAALQAYLDFDERLRKGENISVLSAEDLAAMEGDRTATLEWYASIGEPPPLDVMPELGSEEAWSAHLEDLAAPQVDDGAHEAQCALAAAQLVAEALAGSGTLSHLTQDQLGRLANLATASLAKVTENRLYRETWGTADWEDHVAACHSLAKQLHEARQPDKTGARP